MTIESNKMLERGQNPRADLVPLAVAIVAAYVAHNALPMEELASLVASVHRSLVGLALGSAGMAPAASEPEFPVPTAAQIRRSVTEGGIVSFIDGKSYQTLKRHLSAHGLTPLAYRKRYELPRDYPMVAPAYSAKRSALAKEIGLGRPTAMPAAPLKKGGPSRRRRT